LKYIIYMPQTFKIGDTETCKINGETQQVTWRDKTTLVIEPDDPRAIVTRTQPGDLTCFFCADAGVPADAHDVIREDGGFVIAEKASRK
jgi:hypothetical protein